MIDTLDTLFTAPHLSWLNNQGKDCDIVLGSRIRLARNLKNIPFPNRATLADLQQVKELIVSLIPAIEAATSLHFNCIEIDKLSHLEQDVLIEKFLISEKLVKYPENRLLLISDDLSVAIMVNEDDHLRIQCMASGLDLTKPLERAFAIDDAIESYLSIAFDEKMGYLTACPTNLGTGLRASILLHLPALVMTQQISKIINISPQLGLAVRGLFSVDNLGNVFYISNQLTLGFKEQELVENLYTTVQEIINHEREARKALLSYSRDKLENRVWRSFGILKYARSISEDEMLNLVSKVRLGVDLGIIDESKAEVINLLMIAGQPSYLQNLRRNENMTPQEIDKQRALVIRQIFSQLTSDKNFNSDENLDKDSNSQANN